MQLQHLMIASALAEQRQADLRGQADRPSLVATGHPASPGLNNPWVTTTPMSSGRGAGRPRAGSDPVLQGTHQG